ncbi:hypothetical protein IVB16_29460 [Bradyrhizobium sp. 183]|uniref:hypothetical protein n=1 Tax=unclassified Bradyrhizobium TaxID=2631580 RepID=UPI0020001598|nr:MULTISPECIES: hypothetical protein [unclassified Bradyrhizobium]UPJ78947.1 hypothetical protein IVB17_29465 [Bradyrhizobium sp. 184]UPJ86740.1 hypothetical protein IVB16_29460 [Bradyrhizobium sp. 183]
MWNKETTVARCLLVAVGLTSLLWSIEVLPSSWRMVAANAATTRIIGGDRFRPDTLKEILAVVQSGPSAMLEHPDFVRAKALAHLRFSEESMAGHDSEEADANLSRALRNVRSALAMNPRDSFLWLMLYSVETTRSGFDPHYILYLDQSYAVGPHEGWISLRRNRLGLGAFPTLSDAVRSAVISEFVEMVDADFIDNAASNLIGIGWKYHEDLLAALASADLVSRQGLHKRLAADGIKLSIPGIAVDERPWR